MYMLNCDEKYDSNLEVPDFSIRYSNLLNSYKMNIIIIKDDFNHPTFRYRGFNLFQTMKNNNKYDLNFFNVTELDSLYGLLDKITLVIIQRTPWSFEVENFINVLKSNNIKVLFDIDDLIYNPKYVPSYLNSISNYTEATMNHMFSLSKRYEMLAEKCDGFIVTTEFLKKNVEKDFTKPVWVFHNYLNLKQEKISKEIVSLKDETYSDEKFIIGYFSGSPSHKRDLEIVESALLKLMDEYDNIYLKIVGPMELSKELKKLKDKGRIIQSNKVSFEELQYEIGKVDLNIIPLQKHNFNECKSELKYFESSIVNTFSCATDNEVYKEVINDGIDGFLSDELSWFEKIENIYLNQDKLKDIIDNARIKCYKNYGNKEQEKDLEMMFDDIIETLG